MKAAMLLLVGVIVGAGAHFGWVNWADHLAQPYAGQEQREISSLSPGDIAALAAGEGWGLAKPAELNGYPGPAHVLELADQLSLDAMQEAAIKAEFAAMRQKAQDLGKELIDVEASLDEIFQSGQVDLANLSAVLGEAEKIRASLRETHLAAHLTITPILSPEQTHLYSELRGYNEDHNAHSGH